MNDPMLLRFVEQAPFLAAFIWLVVVFLRHIKDNDAENRKVIDNNTEMMNSVREIMGRCVHAIDHLDQADHRERKHNGVR